MGIDLARLSVEFQPIVNLLTGELVGYEALGRGPGGPGELLDLAARDGDLLELDHGWREAAIAAIAREHAGDELVFFLNVDTRILDDPGFAPGHTHRLLEHHGLDPRRFVLELSERGEALASERISSLASHYRDQGFRVALDDIGAGYSSLTTIVHARPDVLKLDMDLIRGMARDRLRSQLVSAFASFSHAAGVPLVAEGIETLDDLVELAQSGVMWGQGYLLGRPQKRATPLPIEVVLMLRQVREARGTRPVSLRVVHRRQEPAA
jgi:EAL domain-containing protein (putative c-di-GMP-specific phosphodiesterase class I)